VVTSALKAVTDIMEVGRSEQRKMRQIVLDTETTGLDPLNGDRVIEIGAVELVNRFPNPFNYPQFGPSNSPQFQIRQT